MADTRTPLQRLAEEGITKRPDINDAHINRGVIVMNPREIMDLQIELSKHPDLVAKYAAKDTGDLVDILTELAAECNIYMKGIYSGQQLLDLAVMITSRLHKRRTSLIVIGPGDI